MHYVLLVNIQGSLYKTSLYKFLYRSCQYLIIKISCTCVVETKTLPSLYIYSIGQQTECSDSSCFVLSIPVRLAAPGVSWLHSCPSTIDI